MAYVVNVTDSALQTSGTSYTVSLGAHQAGDLLLCKVSSSITGTAITAPVGWAMIGAQADSQAQRSAWGCKYATSGAETNPAFTVASGHTYGTALVIRGANSGGAIGWQRIDWGDSATIASASSNTGIGGSSNGGAAIPYGNNDLMICSWSSDGQPYMRCLSSQLTMDSWLRGSSSSSISHIIGHRQLGAAGTVPAINMVASLATEGGNGWVLVIPTSGELDTQFLTGATELDYFGDFGEVQTPWGTAFAPSTLDDDQASPPANFTINGINGSTSAGTLNHAASISFSTLGFSTSISSAESTAAAWVGASATFSPVKDLSGKVYAVHFAMSVNVTARFGADGAAVVFVDSSGNWVAYQLATKAALQLTGERTAFIRLGQADTLGSSGTIDWTQIKKRAFIWSRAGSSVTADIITVKNEVVLGTATLTGGSSGRPALLSRIKSASQSWGYYNLDSLQADTQTMFKWPLQIGDGASKTYFQAAGEAFAFPGAHSVASATGQQEWNVAATYAGVTVKASASDTMDFRAGLYSTSIAQPFVLDSGSSTSATYYWSGLSLVGYTVTWAAAVNASGLTIKSGAKATISAACTWTGCSISGTTATDAPLAVTVSGVTLSGCTTDGAGAAYNIELGASATSLTLTDHVWGTVGGTNKVHVLKTTGTVTISLNGSTSLSAGEVTSAGAAVNIVSTPVYQTVTISGAVAGSRIQIYDTTSSTELYNGTPTFPYTWTDSSPASASRAIRLRVAKQSGATAKNFVDANIGTCGTLAASAAVSYLVNQTDDTVYNINAIDGSTVTGITITPSPARVKINLGGGAVTYPQIYAYQVYWLATATGIADEAAFIDAPDPANYLFTNFDLRNDSATPLTITGGYGRDAVSGRVADIIDVAGSIGNIYPEPDHAIPYSVGSGLDAGQAAQLSTIATDAVGTRILENGYSVDQVQKLIAAVLLGKVSGGGTATETFKGIDGTTDRVVASVDSSGNRTAITLNSA